MKSFDPASLSPEKRALIEKLLRAKGVAPRSSSAIPRRPEGVDPPLAYLQEGLWFLDQLDPGKATYNIPCATRIVGALDAEALRRAFQELVRRHEVLRTRFVARAGAATQVVDPAGEFPLPVTELAELLPAEREQEASRRAHAEAARPFDLARGPLLRAELLRLGAREHVLVFNMHHIVSDGWSMGVFTRELFDGYLAFAAGREPVLPALPIQFGDFAAWQRDWLTGDTYARLLGFWRERLAGLEELRLPHDRPRPARPSGAGAHHSFDLTPALTARVREFARGEELTPFVVLLAAFDALLHTYSGQTDVVVGSPVANRTKSELEPLIGYFVNVLPFRVDLSGNPSFRELCARTGEAVEAVHAHQEMPFSKLVEELAPKNRSANPIYQVELTLLSPEHAPAVHGYGFRAAVDEVHHLGDLVLTPFKVESGVAKFDLVVLLWDAPAEVQGTFEYDADLFDPETIEEMARRFRAVLARLLEAPEARLGELAAAHAKKLPPGAAGDAGPGGRAPGGPRRGPGGFKRTRRRAVGPEG